MQIKQQNILITKRPFRHRIFRVCTYKSKLTKLVWQKTKMKPPQKLLFFLGDVFSKHYHFISFFIFISYFNKARDTRDLKSPRALQRNLKILSRNSKELQERNSELQRTPKNSKRTPKELLRNSKGTLRNPKEP